MPAEPAFTPLPNEPIAPLTQSYIDSMATKPVAEPAMQPNQFDYQVTPTSPDPQISQAAPVPVAEPTPVPPS